MRSVRCSCRSRDLHIDPQDTTEGSEGGDHQEGRDRGGKDQERQDLPGKGEVPSAQERARADDQRKEQADQRHREQTEAEGEQP